MTGTRSGYLARIFADSTHLCSSAWSSLNIHFMVRAGGKQSQRRRGPCAGGRGRVPGSRACRCHGPSAVGPRKPLYTLIGWRAVPPWRPDVLIGAATRQFGAPPLPRFLAEAELVPGAAHGAVPVRGALRGHHRARPRQLLGVEHVPSVQQAPGGPAASPAPVD